MPTIVVEISEQDWELLVQMAQHQQMTPEQLAQEVIRANLQGNMPRRIAGKKRVGGRSARQPSQLPRSIESLPRGSVHRVMATLDMLQNLFPSDAPPPSREEIDAYLQAEREAWDKTVEK